MDWQPSALQRWTISIGLALLFLIAGVAIHEGDLYDELVPAIPFILMVPPAFAFIFLVVRFVNRRSNKRPPDPP
jgi:hypothetical protein